MWLWLLAYFMPEQGWTVEKTGIYNTVIPVYACLGDRGDLYLADRDEYRILHFDARGRPLESIGGKGQGPGEFSSKLLSLQYLDGRLYAIEFQRSAIKVFWPDGRFMHLIHTPIRWFDFLKSATKVTNGWVFSRRRQIIHVDEDFKLIGALVGDMEKAVSNEPGIAKKRQEFNPAPDKPLFAVNNQGTLVYFYVPGQGFKIYAYDVMTRRVGISIQMDIAAKSFNKSWGEARLADMRANSISRKHFEYVADFPKHFPPMIDLRVDYQNHLRVIQGIALVEKGQGELVFDTSGKMVENTIPRKDLLSILAFDDQWLYLSARGDNDELSIKKVPRANWP